MAGLLDDTFSARVAVPEGVTPGVYQERPMRRATNLEELFVNFIALLNMKRLQENGRHLNMLTVNELDVPDRYLREMIRMQIGRVLEGFDIDETGGMRMLFEWQLLKSVERTIPSNEQVKEQVSTWEESPYIKGYLASFRTSKSKDNRTLNNNLNLISRTNRGRPAVREDEITEESQSIVLANKGKEEDDDSIDTRPGSTGGKRNQERQLAYDRAARDARDAKEAEVVKNFEREALARQNRRDELARQKQQQQQQQQRGKSPVAVPGAAKINVNQEQKEKIDEELEGFADWLKKNKSKMQGMSVYRFVDMNNALLSGAGLRTLQRPNVSEKASTKFMTDTFVDEGYIPTLREIFYENFAGFSKFWSVIFKNIEDLADNKALPLYNIPESTRRTEPREQREPKKPTTKNDAVKKWEEMVEGGTEPDIVDIREFIKKYKLNTSGQTGGINKRTKARIIDEINKELGL